MSRHPSRRALMLTLAAGSALVAVPAAAEDVAASRAAPLLDGHVRVRLGERIYVADTAQLPEVFVVTDEHSDLPEWLATDTVSVPSPGARYLVHDAAGELLVTELERSSSFGRIKDRRLGFYRVSDRMSMGCTVLGLVISEEVVS